ncbi:MAG: hypothetical protein HY862_14225 [Chloroflexi bacterium]|nr:hypothetical protein [Chloroflexota bacterium]
MGKVDTQIIEIMGRNRLANELLAAGIEIALPMRDRGIDLIAYIDIDGEIPQFTAIPIQMKASSGSNFTINQKYQKFLPNLVIVFVWGVMSENKEDQATYALTQEESLIIAEAMGYAQTPSWLEHGLYTSTRPSQKLLELMKPYQMDSTAWRRKIIRLSRTAISD